MGRKKATGEKNAKELPDVTLKMKNRHTAKSDPVNHGQAINNKKYMLSVMIRKPSVQSCPERIRDVP
jgi:hypothetical protein